MKSIVGIASFVLCAASMWVSVQRRINVDAVNSKLAVATTTSDEKNWDEKNRRPVDEVFFFKTPSWMRGSKSTDAYTPREAAASDVQANPFTE
jgi:hypothetical protein